MYLAVTQLAYVGAVIVQLGALALEEGLREPPRLAHHTPHVAPLHPGRMRQRKKGGGRVGLRAGLERGKGGSSTTV